ncbi:MAG: hypothetical protein IJ632_01560 [Muribaculaceae bacterium]|nr:hypothetical protein [Muribaculaceae bacterium]
MTDVHHFHSHELMGVIEKYRPALQVIAAGLIIFQKKEAKKREKFCQFKKCL